MSLEMFVQGLCYAAWTALMEQIELGWRVLRFYTLYFDFNVRTQDVACAWVCHGSMGNLESRNLGGAIKAHNYMHNRLCREIWLIEQQ
ncbi:hypothetical protein TorRG33x02_243830 [Trema orientale]|uniref:Uncharacterized protein n=1 Tax=Trema orientale TaxID=63057 RepID=A0A2P5DRS8_TREOI|nr:hypothetical protein TorRG33x02_243830 [Trema orientale]